LIAPASHEDHTLFRDNNAQVYYFLEEATRGTTFAVSIKPFQRRKDGRRMAEEHGWLLFLNMQELTNGVLS